MSYPDAQELVKEAQKWAVLTFNPHDCPLGSEMVNEVCIRFAKEVVRQAEEIAALRRDAGQLEYADCTLCSAVPSSGFYTGCMVKDGNAAGWSCKQGKLVRWRGDAALAQGKKSGSVDSGADDIQEKP